MMSELRKGFELAREYLKTGSTDIGDGPLWKVMTGADAQVVCKSTVELAGRLYSMGLILNALKRGDLEQDEGMFIIWHQVDGEWDYCAFAEILGNWTLTQVGYEKLKELDDAARG